MSLYGELKRRNVIRVAVAYLIGSWLLVQLAGIAFPFFGLPDWSIRLLYIALALGFLPALAFAWAFVITPGGVIRDEPVSRSSAQWIDIVTITLVLVAIVYFVVYTMWPDHDATQQQANQSAVSSEHAEVEIAPAEPVYTANSIAVLPFVNMSDDPANEYFSDGVSEELLNLLAQVTNLKVTSRSSAFSFKDKEFDIKTVADKLRVAHVIEGSVRKTDDRVRITVQLIDARSDVHLWSAAFDRKLDDIFAIQDEIARTVVERLKVTLLGDVPTSKPIATEAYTLYLQARHLGRQYTARALEQSNSLYESALAIEADIAGAWSGLATNYTNQAMNGLVSFKEGFSRARLAAEKSLEIDPDYAPAHANLGWIAYGYDNDVVQAARHYQQALYLDPTNTYIIRSVAVLLRSLDRLDDAIALGKHATSLDPLVASGHHNLGISYFRARQWDESIASQQIVLDLSPDYIGANYYIGAALLLNGKPQAALNTFAREPDEEYQVKGAAMALHALDRHEESQTKLAELSERWGRDWPTEVAHVHAYMGNVEAAFQWLDKAIEQNEEGLAEQFQMPYYESLHDDSRWGVFLERVGSTPEQIGTISFEVLLPDFNEPGRK
jgi:TolB-like protein/lipoprotein NlpI